MRDDEVDYLGWYAEAISNHFPCELQHRIVQLVVGQQVEDQVSGPIGKLVKVADVDGVVPVTL